MQGTPNSGYLGILYLRLCDIGENTLMHDPLSVNAGNLSFIAHAPKSTIITSI